MPSVKEVVIEALSALWVRSPYFFINLFKCYDCDFDRTDLTVSLIKLICRLSSSDASVYTTQNVPPICMEGLLALVDGMHDRIKTAAKNDVQINTVEPHPLILQHKKKSDFIECVKQWNKKPAKGLELLYEKGFIKDKNDLEEYAKFLFEKSGRIDKKKLGELLAKPDHDAKKQKGKKKQNTPVDPNKKTLLKEFLKLLDFKNLRPDEALRMMLNNFRLPGEAQQIDRLVDAFSERYVECQEVSEEVDLADGEEEDEEKVTPDKDSLQILSFSIIMLNTDLHNPNIKKPMQMEDYQKNLRGCYNGGKSFPPWYTEKIYSSIKEKEIIMPEEHKGTAKWFESTWHNLVAEQESKLLSEFSAISLISDNGESVEELLQFDKAIFEKTARYIIANLITMFDDATHDSIVTRMMSTVEKTATIASYFGMTEIVDLIIEVVSHMTTLTGIKKSEYALESREYIPITELKLEKENEIITVSDLAVLFGRDFRAQLSTVVLFRVIKKSNYRVTFKWENVVKIFLTLFENGLIEPDFFPEFQKKLGLEKLTKPKPEYQYRSI
ncbi:unnamed protein product [Ambrosiozyma monospora]|uniref:Unnamed protein product n=1 Tax=Ambrosiozyma monospora TaxID=43982 RepID=A0ACB5T9X6_AMBMO|nr:unnamed protein product [Ambrosiozyma monospora]